MFSAFNIANSLRGLATQLKNAKGELTDVDVAARAGLTQQSVAKILGGEENFFATALLVLAESLGQTVLIVPSDSVRDLLHHLRTRHITSMTDGLNDI